MLMTASAGEQAKSTLEMPTTLRVTTTGAWARPGWYELLARMEAEGKFGPEDIDELYTDYAKLAVKDQEDCGLDILTDGEVRRKSWIRYIVRNVPNIQQLPLRRQLGPYGWDQQETYALKSKIENLESIWDYTDEFNFLRANTDRLPKICFPGPFGISTQLDFHDVYRSRSACAEALVPAISRQNPA